MTDTTSTPAAMEAVPVSLPAQNLKFLSADGTVSLPWRRFFQQSYARSGGGTDQTAANANAIASGVDPLAAAIEQAEADAAAALAGTDLGQLLGLVDLQEGQEGDAFSIGDLLAIQALDSAGAASAAPLAVKGGVLPLVNGDTPFLGFIHTPDGQTIGCPL